MITHSTRVTFLKRHAVQLPSSCARGLYRYTPVVWLSGYVNLKLPDVSLLPSEEAASCFCAYPLGPRVCFIGLQHRENILGTLHRLRTTSPHMLPPSSFHTPRRSAERYFFLLELIGAIGCTFRFSNNICIYIISN